MWLICIIGMCFKLHQFTDLYCSFILLLGLPCLVALSGGFEKLRKSYFLTRISQHCFEITLLYLVSMFMTFNSARFRII